MYHVGLCYDADPNASEPMEFRYEVGERRERWGEGISVIHNPNALHPLADDAYADATNYRIEGERIYATGSGFHPFMSKTLTFTVREPAR